MAKRNTQLLGKNAIFTPDVMDDIHIKAQLGRYRMRGMALMKKIPHWDDLTFLPGTLTRFVIEGYREKCLTKTVELGLKRFIVPETPISLAFEAPCEIFAKSVLCAKSILASYCKTCSELSSAL